ncbi:unnamed protein product [Lathyrus sativus]|nr:unnamed protein product [Lathyrus sativus]
MLRHNNHNDTVLIQPELGTTVKKRKHHSPIGYELPSHLPPPILPDDLIFEILLILPVRSLLQFRCVCKSWKTLISNPLFTKNQLRLSMLNPTITHQQLVSSNITHNCKIVSCPVKPLFENPSEPVEPVSVRMNRKYHILGSCNGLLCLYDIHLGYVRLWNPATRLRSRKSPKFVGSDGVITCHGFGYDHVNDKYKVLVVVGDLNESVTKLYTFGETENSWTTIQDFPCIPTRWLGKFVNGSLNWFAKEGFGCNQWIILTFDLAKETYGKLLLPRQKDGDRICNPVLDVLSNCLCICFDSNETHWVLWLMKEYGVEESWTKLMLIPHAKFWHPKYRPCFKPLCILDNGVILMKTLYSILVLYDANTGMLDYPRTLGKLGLDLHVYHETLISPLW